MVGNVTSLTGNGLRDWLVQRVSAVILAVYTLFLIGYILFHPGIDYQQWLALFQSTWMKIASLLVLLSLMLHAWVGLWTILTDYIKCVYLQLTLYVLVLIALFSFVVWGVQILWGL